MKIKTSELTGAALDWAVAKCERVDPEAARLFHSEGYYNYSSNWAQGGPIIEREGIDLTFLPGIGDMPSGATNDAWAATHCEYNYSYRGETPLIAAMRCYCASKLGDEVEIPEELK